MRLPVESFGDKNRINPAGILPTEDICQRYYLHVEKDYTGGYFPLGKNKIWHGGIHIHCKRGEKIYNISDGVIVAARLGEDETAIKHYGSVNFLLVKHTYKTYNFYCLYQHLNTEKMYDTNSELEEYSWLRTNGKIDSDLMTKLKTGAVCKINKKIRAGELLWGVGVFGSKTVLKDYRSSMFHWGIFSEYLLPGSWTQREDLDENINCDNASISAVLDNLIDKNNDKNWSDSEIVNFYKDTSKSSTVRDYACKFIFENAIDWNLACKSIQTNLGQNADPQKIFPYNFWDEAKKIGVSLPSKKHVWHYNPVTLVRQANEWDMDLKVFAIKLWAVQIGGLDQVGKLKDPFKETFGKWSNKNWLDIGKTGDTIAAAEARAQELMDLVEILRIESKSGSSTAVAVNILDPIRFTIIILREAAIRLETYKHYKVLFPHLIPTDILYNKQVRPSLQYLVYNLGNEPEYLYPIVLSGMVYACISDSFEKLKSSLKSHNSLFAVISGLKSKVKSTSKEDMVEKALNNEHLITAWLCNETNMQLFTHFLENSDSKNWASWEEPRGNVSRYNVLNEYYSKVFN